MAIATVTDLTGISAEHMDRYESDYLLTVSNPPPGLLTYVMGVSGDVVRIVEVWDSEEARDVFYRDRVAPATDSYLEDGLPALEGQVEEPLSVRFFYSAGSGRIEPGA